MCRAKVYTLIWLASVCRFNYYPAVLLGISFWADGSTVDSE
jgi:hypothetical protein